MGQNKHILAYAPKTLKLNFNHAYSSVGIDGSIEKKKTYISSPYWSLRNNLVVMMSQPIYDKTHQYLVMTADKIEQWVERVSNQFGKEYMFTF